MRKQLLTLLLGTSLVMGLAACGGGGNKKDTSKDNGGGTTTQTSNANDAQKIFNQKCSSCHGGDMKGGMGPNLTKVGSKYSKAEILDILKKGKAGGMPAGLVTGDDANTMATWLSGKK